MAYSISVIGLGKIAKDQHLPSIAKNPDFRLAAVCSPRGDPPPGLDTIYRTVDEMLKAVPDLDAVAVCTPPLVRHELARAALLAGKHVLLEKPPAATLSELEDLRSIASERGHVLFATWHAQYNAAVEEAARRLKGQSIAQMHVEWREDVRKWHPGQRWVWQAGGFGVFDPGINALSIVTAILPEPIWVRRAELHVPANADSPISARLEFASNQPGAKLAADFDWNPTPHETWEVRLRTEAGQHLHLLKGGARLEVDGAVVTDEASDEYGGIYRRFAELLRSGTSQVDARPFQLVADAFMIGKRVGVAAVEM